MRRLVVPGVIASCSVCELSITSFCITAQTKKNVVYRLAFIVPKRIYSTLCIMYTFLGSRPKS